MKKLLVLVLLVLWLAPDAGAISKYKVFIYAFTEKSTEYTCDVNGVTDFNDINYRLWNKSVKSSAGYLFIQWDSPTSLSVWTVTMEKQKALGEDGKLHRSVLFTGSPSEYSIAQAGLGLGKKTTWLVGAGSDMERILLMGDQKPVKLAGLTTYAATKLAGSKTWYYLQDNVLHVGSATHSLRWQSRMTNDYYKDDGVSTAREGMESFLYGLIDKNYVVNDP